MKTVGDYDIFLTTSISYEDQSWTEIVSYTTRVVNPCEDTILVYNTTLVEEQLRNLTYSIGESTKTINFNGVSDTVTGNLTTSGSCGLFIYTLANEDPGTGTPFIAVEALYNTTMGIQV